MILHDFRFYILNKKKNVYIKSICYDNDIFAEWLLDG